MDDRDGDPVWRLRVAAGRRAAGAPDPHSFISAVLGMLGCDGGRRYSQSGCSDPGGAARESADVVSVRRLHLSRPEHSAAAPGALDFRTDAVLPRSAEGCVSSWGRVAASMARANRPQSPGLFLFLAGLVLAQRDAD